MYCSKLVAYFIVYFIKYSLSDDLSLATDELEEEFGRIIYASVLFRHGDRTIDHPYPKDPYPLSTWKEGIGELTKTGKVQEYELGKWFRKRYENPLNISDYKADEVRMDSSDTNRTVMSAQLVLAGFYIPSKREQWDNDGLNWQPVPVHSISSSVDNILGCHALCAQYENEKIKLTNTKEILAYQDTYNDLLPYIEKHSGLEFSYDEPTDIAENLSYLYDTLFIEELKNFTLPQWTQKVYPEPLRTISRISFIYIAYTDKMKMLRTGPLLGRMVQDMVAKKNHTLSEKIHFYSAHDSTLVPFLDTLGVFNNILIPYSASVLVELRLKNKQYFVTVSYRNSTTDAPYILEVVGCGRGCKLEKFIEVTKNVIPDDWEDACKVDKFAWNIILVYITPFLLLVIVLLVVKSETIRSSVINIKKRKPVKSEYEEIGSLVKS